MVQSPGSLLSLRQLEDERKQDMHSANERQREFSKREKKIEVCALSRDLNYI